MPLSNADFVDAFHRRILGDRVPFSGSVDLTYRCNLGCVHCYCADRSADGGGGSGAAAADELSGDELARLFDQFAEAGCLFLLLTGGDPLLRRDFEAVYRHAKACGFFVTVFTNGTSIRPHTVDLLRDLPPRSVEITLYGASDETYRRVTGVAGAYRRCRAGIESLLAAGVKTKLKTVLMQTNVDDFPAMKQLAADYDVPFRFDAGLTGRMDGDLAPLNLRVPAADVVAMEFADEKYVDGWLEAQADPRSRGDPARLFNCGAGRTAFHVDFNGMLRSCITSRWADYDLRQIPFREAWRRLGRDIDDLRAPEGHACNACTLRPVCTWCPVFSDLEGTRDAGPSPYLCEQAAARAARLELKRSMEARHDGNTKHREAALHHAAVAEG